MSCLIQKPENTAALADWMQKLLDMSYEYSGMFAPANLSVVLRNLGCCDNYGYYCKERIYNALVDLNYKAYAERYRLDGKSEYSRTPYASNPVAKRVEWVAGRKNSDGFYTNGHHKISSWHYKILKMLHFFCYQCNEDATNNSDLYKALKELENALADFIVVNSDDYCNLEWE